jgi:subtilisin family serine protease/subtilisin-like proprotein convertase family protein
MNGRPAAVVAMNQHPLGKWLWTIVACGVVGIVWKWGGASPGAVTSGQPSGTGRRSLVGVPQANEPPSGGDREWRVTVDDGEFVVAMNACMVSHTDGSQLLQEIIPPATRATLRARLAERNALPVGYQRNERGGFRQMQVVTRDLRLKLIGEEPPLLVERGELVLKSRPSYAPGWWVVSADDALAALEVLPRLRAAAGVVAADVLLARQRTPKSMPNDPLVSSQWHLKNSGATTVGTDLNVESAWNFPAAVGVRGAGVRIGVVDDGIDHQHEDLAPNYDGASGWDWNGNDSNPAAGSGDKHGTACAGNAAARGNNSLGGSGVAPEATLVGLRLISAPATDQQEAEAMIWKNDLIQVKSNSWGPADGGRTLEGPGPLTLAALETATTTGRGGLGTILVWAAGNGAVTGDNSNYDGYANSIHTIAVGAIDSRANAAQYSESGANVLVCAPSDGASPALGITTTDRVGSAGYNTAVSGAGGDYTNTFGGTSSATPLVAGVVALILEKNPLLGWRDVQEILIRSATKCRPLDVGWATNGSEIPFHPKFGAGLVNASAAVTLASNWENLPPQTSHSQSAVELGMMIPENSSVGATRSFRFSDTHLRVEHVTLTLDVTHTSRGNLQVVLTSPHGTESVLAEVHSDNNDHIRNWTFSTVRNWGETADGEWLLKIADLSPAGNSLGGTLNAATLRVYGSEIIPRNPPPVVAILTPEPGSVFSPGAVVQVFASAEDLTITGGAGTVSEVRLLDNGVLVGTLTSPPYRFEYVPTVGEHQLVAQAVDDEGAMANSPPVAISIEDRPPVITAVELNTVGQAYADQDLRVNSIVAVDPDGSSLTATYQWQSSIDGLFYQDASDEASEVLAASGSHAGKLWRCVVSVNDGVHSSPPLASAAVNVLARPVAAALPGRSYSYASGLVLAGDPVALNRHALIHEFSQGPAGGNSEWVEILVLKTSDMRYWDLSDTTNSLVFSTHSGWSSIPAGTLVVIYNGNTIKDPLLPEDDLDPADGKMVVSSTHPQFFDASFDSWIPLANNGDVIAMNDASSATIDSLCYGNSTAAAVNVGSVGSNRAAYFSGDTEAEAKTVGGWQTTAANGAVTPGAANTMANAAFLASVSRGNPHIPARFRLAAGSALPPGLMLDSVSGEISGTVAANAAAAEFLIEIERINGSGDRVSQQFHLTLGSVNGYESWIAGFDVNPAADLDSEGDGLANLVEYAFGSSPVAVDDLIRYEISPGEISLRYPQSRNRPDVDLQPEWASTLGPGAVWNATGISVQRSEVTETSQWIRASLPIAPGEPRRFLRLKAFRVK